MSDAVTGFMVEVARDCAKWVFWGEKDCRCIFPRSEEVERVGIGTDASDGEGI